VRRAFQTGRTSRAEGRALLGRMLALYKSPRLAYAWLLYACGARYEVYQRSLQKAAGLAALVGRGRGGQA
jgi:hypothetical protein